MPQVAGSKRQGRKVKPSKATVAASVPVVDETVMTQEHIERVQNARFREIGMLTRSLIEAQDALERERREHAETKTAARETSRLYNEMLESNSWRVTAPMRWVTTKLRR